MGALKPAYVYNWRTGAAVRKKNNFAKIVDLGEFKRCSGHFLNEEHEYVKAEWLSIVDNADSFIVSVIGAGGVNYIFHSGMRDTDLVLQAACVDSYVKSIIFGEI